MDLKPYSKIVSASPAALAILAEYVGQLLQHEDRLQYQLHDYGITSVSVALISELEKSVALPAGPNVLTNGRLRLSGLGLTVRWMSVEGTFRIFTVAEAPPE